MLHMMLGILKIVGFLILFLFLFITAVMVLVLFVPVRYQAEGTFDGQIQAAAKVSWLLCFLKLEVRLQEKKPEFIIRILGYPLRGKERKKKSEITTDSDNKESAEQFLEDEENEESKETENKDFSRMVSPKDVPELEKDQKTESLSQAYSKQSEVEEDFVETDHIGTDHMESDHAGAGNEKKRINLFKEKFHNLMEKKDHLLHFWNRPSTKRAVAHGKKEVLYLIRHIRPRKVKGQLLFGMEDPAVTGQILGILCVLQSFSGNQLEVGADFEKKILEGNVFLKGHIRTCHFVKVILGMLLDKQVRITIRGIRTLEL